jgi:hypothetical protein
MVRDVVGRLMSRPFSAGLVVCLTALGSGAAIAQSTSRPPAEKPTSTAPAAPPAATARAPAGTSASRPSTASGSGGGYNPGGNSGGSGYNPGSSSSRPDYNPSGAWNGATGDGWNPGNYYQRSVIQGWVRLGFAEAGKGADKDTIQANGRYRYSRIKLCVRVADVAFYDAQVQFEAGGRQDIRVQSRVKTGQCTREYYLRGGKRLDIRYVYLFFRQADNITNWRTARVDLYAR